MRSKKGQAGALSLALIGALASGCGTVPLQESPGVLTVTLTTTAPARGPTVIGGSLRLEDVSIRGDVAPDDRSERTEIRLSLVGTQTVATFSALPPGIYSRLRFYVDGVVLEGDYGERRLHVDYGEQPTEPDVAMVDLAATTPLEILPGQSGNFQLLLDLGKWFGDGDLDGAEFEGDDIYLDGTHNLGLAQTIGGRLADSFSLE